MDTLDRPADQLSELEAREEVAAIDQLVAEAGKTIQRLKERRKAVLPLAEASPREAAAILHVEHCAYGHGTGGQCAWQNESKGWDRWEKPAHQQWLKKARAKIDGSGLSDADYIDRLRSITGEPNRELALLELRPDDEKTEKGDSW